MAELFGGINDTIMDGIQSILYATIYKLLYYIAVGCCWIVNLLYSMFEVVAGLSKVSYDGDYDYLINVFFSNTTVSKIYWGMALIGLAAGFAFAIAAVIKKLFDSYEKEKRSYGQILTGLFKSVLTIVCMSLIITMVLNATTLLMQQISYIFVNADAMGDEESIVYTDEEYAAMTRVYNTIGNFSLNPSYNNRYNLNKCFNEIRFDLQYLKNHGVFDFHYVTTDVEGNTIATWQSALQKIANSASLDRDLSLDAYHESTSKAILEAMDLLKVNGSFKPLEEYHRHYQASRNSLSMDRLLFLMASMRAAKNEDYNLNPSLTDPLRGAYYYGEKSIYDLDTVNEDFDIGIAALDYVILFLTCYKMLETLATIILNCIGRIFNMLLLYLISPIIISISPLDDGAKFKQWTTAFIVQSFSVFGTVISMRVLLLFMPIVVDPKLVLFENPIGNLLTKLVIILGAFEVSEKATNLITGILADNAGWQSITAGDMSGTAKSVVAKGEAMAKSAVSSGVSGAVTAGFGAVKYGGIAGLGASLAAGYGVYALGKGAVTGTKALANKISAWRNSGYSNAGGSGQGTESVGNNSNPTNKQTDSLPTSQRDQHPTNTKEDDIGVPPNNTIENIPNPSAPKTDESINNSQDTGSNNKKQDLPSNQGTNSNNNHGEANPQNVSVPDLNGNRDNPQQVGRQPNPPGTGSNGTGVNSQPNNPANNQFVHQGSNNPALNSQRGGEQQNPVGSLVNGTGVNSQPNNPANNQVVQQGSNNPVPNPQPGDNLRSNSAPVANIPGTNTQVNSVQMNRTTVSNQGTNNNGAPVVPVSAPSRVPVDATIQTGVNPDIPNVPNMMSQNNVLQTQVPAKHPPISLNNKQNNNNP